MINSKIYIRIIVVITLIILIFNLDYILAFKRFDSGTSNYKSNDNVSDPLGQDARDKGSFPINPPFNTDIKNDIDIIKRLQLSLFLLDYYKGPINGEFTRQTLQAVKKYQYDVGLNIQSEKILDSQTLITLGVISR